MKHPNAAVSAGGFSLSTLVVWVAGNVLHWSLSAEDGAVVAGLVTTVVLFVGRNGVRGLWRRIWAGQDGLTMVEAAILLMIVALVVLMLKVF